MNFKQCLRGILENILFISTKNYFVVVGSNDSYKNNGFLNSRFGYISFRVTVFYCVCYLDFRYLHYAFVNFEVYLYILIVFGSIVFVLLVVLR